MRYTLYVFLLVAFMSCSQNSNTNGSENPGADFDTSAYTVEDVSGSNIQYIYKKDDRGDYLEEGFVKNGKRDGAFMVYDPETKHIIEMSHFNEGILHGPQFEYNGRGQLEKRVTLVNGKQHGLYVEYRNGRYKKMVTYEDGQVDGFIKEFSDRGRLFKYSEYKDNQLHGDVVNYNEDGNEIVRYEYKNGEKVSGGLVN